MASPSSPPTTDAAHSTPVVIAPPSADGIVEVDNNEGDSAYGDNNSTSDWTSVTSSIYKGVFENGRRYQSTKEGEYFLPADEQQAEAMANTHLAFLLHDQFEENQLFRSPLGKGATDILDIGTGSGEWAVDVADKFPGITVHAVDLDPPKQSWVPPNCIFEVDDVTKPWTWTQKFDLVHLRWMAGSFSEEEWAGVYREAYRNLRPGGWIEQVEPAMHFSCDDGSVPPSSNMGRWGQMSLDCGRKGGRPLDTLDTMRGALDEAGFVNIHEQDLKFPHGTWPKKALMKEVGRIHMAGLRAGMQGYAMFLLTHFGSPKPWSQEKVELYLMQVRQELSDKNRHAYSRLKRVWAQKPVDTNE